MTLIHTNRFLLRPFDKADAPALAALCNDELIARNTSRIPYPYTDEDADYGVQSAMAGFTNGSDLRFAVCDGAEIVGCCGVTRITVEMFELGYWIAAPARGEGAATEAARAVAHFAFQRRDAEKLLAGHFADNPASGRVLEKVGFRHTGETRKQFSLGRGGEAESFRMALARKHFTAPADVVFA